MKVAISGDLKGSRTIHSFVYALARFGATIDPLPAPGMELPRHVDRRLREEFHCRMVSKAPGAADDSIDALYVTADQPHQLSLYAEPEVDYGLVVEKKIDAVYVTRFQKERWTEKDRPYPKIDATFLGDAKSELFPALVRAAGPMLIEVPASEDLKPVAADFAQNSFRSGNGRAQAKANAAFQLPRSEHARTKVCADAQSFQTRSQRRPGHSAVEASDHSDAWVGQRRGHPAQVVGCDANVAVVDNQAVIASFRQHLRQVADLHVRAQDLRTNQQLNSAIGELPLQFLHALDCRVAGVAHPKNDFVFRIVLQAVAAKAFIHFRIGAFEGFKNRDGRQRLFRADAWFNLPFAQESRSAPNTQEIVNATGERPNDRDDLNYSDDGMNHAVMSN